MRFDPSEWYTSMIINVVISFPRFLISCEENSVESSQHLTWCPMLWWPPSLSAKWSRARVTMASLCSSTLACYPNGWQKLTVDHLSQGNDTCGICRTRVCCWPIRTLLLLQDTAYLSTIQSTNIYRTRDNNLGLNVVSHNNKILQSSSFFIVLIKSLYLGLQNGSVWLSKTKQCKRKS